MKQSEQQIGGKGRAGKIDEQANLIAKAENLDTGFRSYVDGPSFPDPLCKLILAKAQSSPNGPPPAIARTRA